uniref:protein-serine/threonine phosphatase n=1 Tax=Ananas comosus var. bracteatus TaxID=296719 RepID=A0A6V7PET3_ANACO|nr:unnamed protein product [Ananas comosus var. bracteatus]
MSGTTAITVLVSGDTLYVANVGDSRAVAGVWNGSAVVAEDLSCDQTPFRKDEYERNDDGDPPRLWVPNGMYPGTAFTRSVGDSTAESIGVIAEPEVKVLKIASHHLFFVIASDGVFEFLSSQAVLTWCLNLKILGMHAQQLFRSLIRIGPIGSNGILQTSSKASQVVERVKDEKIVLRMSEAFHHPGSPKEPSSACVAPSLAHPLSVETSNRANAMPHIIQLLHHVIITFEHPWQRQSILQCPSPNFHTARFDRRMDGSTSCDTLKLPYFRWIFTDFFGSLKIFYRLFKVPVRFRFPTASFSSKPLQQVFFQMTSLVLRKICHAEGTEISHDSQRQEDSEEHSDYDPADFLHTSKFLLSGTGPERRDRSPQNSVAAACEATGPRRLRPVPERVYAGRDRSHAGRDRFPSVGFAGQAERPVPGVGETGPSVRKLPRAGCAQSGFLRDLSGFCYLRGYRKPLLSLSPLFPLPHTLPTLLEREEEGGEEEGEEEEQTWRLWIIFFPSFLTFGGLELAVGALWRIKLQPYLI